jgi:hypothetical protein
MIARLLENYPQGRRKGVSRELLDAAPANLGFDIPADIRKFYGTTDGLVIHERRLKLNDFETAVRYAMAIARFDIASALGLLPLTESNDSNPFCVACKPPLTGRIIHVHHDDAWRLAFRKLDEFAGAILALAALSNWHIDDISYGYGSDHRDRTHDDDIAADEILRLCDSRLGECDEFLLMAISLYSKNRVSSIIDFLKHESMWTREEAANQLANMGDRRAIEPLEKLARSRDTWQDGRAAQNALKKLNQSQETL